MIRFSAFCVVVLSGCGATTIPAKQPLPVVITSVKASPAVVVTRYVELPAELTKDCIEVAKNPAAPFDEEATRLSNERLAANDECTARMRKIRAKQNSIVD